MEKGPINVFIFKIILIYNKSSQLKNIAHQTLKGIAYMHSMNIIHRDIKP